MISNVSMQVLDLIIKKHLWLSLTDLERQCSALDQRINGMIISQIISDLVHEKTITPVFMNPVTRKYQELPDPYQVILSKVDPDSFRNVYARLKHKAAKEAKTYLSEVVYDDHTTDPVIDQEIKEGIDEWLKESRPGFFKRLFSRLFR
jgi:hypothetical protein